MMHRLSILFVTLAAIAACAPQPAPRTYPVSAPDGLPALDWQTRLEGREIYVQLEDPSGFYETVTMDLIAPGGQRIPASSVTDQERIYRDSYGYGRPSVGVGGAAGSHGGGVGVGMSFPLGGSAPRRPDRERVIVGRFVVPDLYAYRQTASDWEIEMALTSYDGETSRATIPAPLP